MSRIAEDIIGSTLLDDTTEIHHDDAIGEMAHHMKIVAYEQDREAEALTQIGEQIYDLSLDRDVQSCDRFVSDNEIRIG
jgi:hypothetical protein